MVLFCLSAEGQDEDSEEAAVVAVVVVGTFSLSKVTRDFL